MSELKVREKSLPSFYWEHENKNNQFFYTNIKKDIDIQQSVMVKLKICQKIDIVLFLRGFIIWR